MPLESQLSRSTIFHCESDACHCLQAECPVDAIKPDNEPGLEKWLSLNAEYAKIWPNITIKKAPPPDSKEFEGKPDKLQYFSSNPGTGD
jgi:ferredoxin